MKASELRALTTEELSQKARENRAKLFEARVKHATGQLENTAPLGGLKREGARIETILRDQREAK